MANKGQYESSCEHTDQLLSKMRLSGIILTSKTPSPLFCDAYCEQCEKWTFNVEIGSFSPSTREYDYGIHLIARNLEEESSAESVATYINAKNKRDLKKAIEAIEGCTRNGCLNTLYRSRPACSGDDDRFWCEVCKAKKILLDIS